MGTTARRSARATSTTTTELTLALTLSEAAYLLSLIRGGSWIPDAHYEAHRSLALKVGALMDAAEQETRALVEEALRGR